MSVVIACPELLEPASHALAFLLVLFFPLAETCIPRLFPLLFFRNLKGIPVLFCLAQKWFTEDVVDHLLFGPASLADYVLENELEVVLEECLFESQLALAEVKDVVIQHKALL